MCTYKYYIILLKPELDLQSLRFFLSFINNISQVTSPAVEKNQAHHSPSVYPLMLYLHLLPTESSLLSCVSSISMASVHRCVVDSQCEHFQR